jgi:hypothetical protein
MPFDPDDDRPEQRVQSHDKMIVVIFGIEDSHPACAHGSGRSEPFVLFGKYRRYERRLRRRNFRSVTVGSLKRLLACPRRG